MIYRRLQRLVAVVIMALTMALVALALLSVLGGCGGPPITYRAFASAQAMGPPSPWWPTTYVVHAEINPDGSLIHGEPEDCPCNIPTYYHHTLRWEDPLHPGVYLCPQGPDKPPFMDAFICRRTCVRWHSKAVPGLNGYTREFWSHGIVVGDYMEASP